MKKLVLLSIFLIPLNLQAACKCTCDPADSRMCASSIDLDHPCGNLCPGQTPGLAPMITACPVFKTIHPLTLETVWITKCP